MARVIAHLIVGSKPEPFLPAMLESLAGAVEHLYVNENSGLAEQAPNLGALRSCALAADGRMTLDRTVFSTFAAARNRCFELDRDANDETWVVFVDADEVHAPDFARIARRLDRLPASIGFVDGYTWHFFKSFDWYASIERRMMLHRWTPRAHWQRDVHEQLAGIPGARLALPYVYAHYGHVSPFAEDARKGAQYKGLGATGTPLTMEEALAADLHGDYRAVDAYFAPLWRRLMRFRGAHPSAARTAVRQMHAANAQRFREIDGLVRKHQPPIQRAANAAMKLNYAFRWRARTVDAARYGML